MAYTDKAGSVTLSQVLWSGTNISRETYLVDHEGGLNGAVVVNLSHHVVHAAVAHIKHVEERNDAVHLPGLIQFDVATIGALGRALG